SNTSSGFLGVYRSTDSGDSWNLRANSPNLLGWSLSGSDTGGQGWYDLAIAVSPLDPEEIYTGGVNIWKSVNGGLSWSISSMWYAVGGVATVHADQHDLFFVPGTGTLYAGNDGGVYRTTDGGDDWDWLGEGLRITQFYRFGNSPTDPDKVLAGAQDNGTKLADGSFWSDHIGGDGMESLIDYSDPLIMYGTIYYGSIYRTTNGGANWTTITNGISETGGWITPYVIDPVDPLTLYGAYQHVWKTTNRGATWSIISNFAVGTLSHLTISQSDPSTMYAGNGGFLFRTTDGGATDWVQMTRPPGFGTITDIEVHRTDPNHIWATLSGYFDGQKVSESLDGGLTWTNISGTLPNIPTNCILYQNDSPDRVYVGTDLGVWYRDMTMTDWAEYNDELANVTVTELEMQYATNKLRAATFGRGVWESDAVLSSSVTCDEFDSFLARCNGNGAVQAMVLLQNSTQFAGETISFLVDSTVHHVELMTNGIHSIGRLGVPHAGIGNHSVTLIDPVGCYGPVEVTCSSERSGSQGTFDELWSDAEQHFTISAETVPKQTRLIGNYPNPFNPSTTITFELATDEVVSVRIFDLLGREVAGIVDEALQRGTYTRQWNADAMAAGVYLLRMQAGSVVETHRIVLLH
ncbi:MAG: T9SS type A sorting domain-containing protein, partial [Ignavibacteria bacterium]|nr:T9SS type A sorting domain-containing protein [Ignavibacteria bacterium]